MRIVLDTCALIAFAEREPMRAEAMQVIREAQVGATAFVPSVVALEIAQKAAKGRLQFVRTRSLRAWFHAVFSHEGFREVPTSIHFALAAYELPEPFHKDPADRLIVALARLLDAPVVTVDRQILAYGRLGHVQTIAY
jgi:PIN domain nuclease of toxin-antitoxin system